MPPRLAPHAYLQPLQTRQQPKGEEELNDGTSTSDNSSPRAPRAGSQELRLSLEASMMCSPLPYRLAKITIHAWQQPS